MAIALTEFQKKKLIHMFELLDADGNGVLEYDDFQAVIDTLADERGWERGSRRYAKLTGTNRRIWKAILQACNIDGNAQIHMHEWLAYHIQVLTADVVPNANFSITLKAIAEFFFLLMDCDGDGKASIEDYVLFCHAHGIPEEEARYGFPELDRDGNGELSKDEVLELVKEFYLSDDPDAPGNLFFGDFSE